MVRGTTFIGHIWPGSFFIGFGTWWLVCILLRYRRCVITGRRFQASASYRLTLFAKDSELETYSWLRRSCLVALSRLPLEAVFKLLAALVGTLSEIATGWDRGRHRFRPSGTQHMAMYLLYSITGFTDLLAHCKVYFAPKNIDYAGLLFTFGGEAFLLFLHGRPGDHGNIVEHSCHHLLFLQIVLCCFLIVVEIFQPHSLVIALARAYALLLHGAWFYATAFIMAPPWYDFSDWNLNNPENVMYVVALFIFIAIGLFIGLVLTAAYLLLPVRQHILAQRRYSTVILPPVTINKEDPTSDGSGSSDEIPLI